MDDEQRSQAQALASEAAAEPKWGDPLERLDEARKAELTRRLFGWKPEQATVDMPGPFATERLNGLDVFWLAACAVAGPDGDPVAEAQSLTEGIGFDSLSNLHLEKALLHGAYLKWAVLRQAHLEQADLGESHLEGAILSGVHLDEANLYESQLAGADLVEAHLKRTDLGGADLKGAALHFAHLEGANLALTHLEGAALEDACLEGTDLYKAHLEGATFVKARLDGANLGMATLDKATRLNGVSLADAVLDQVVFDGTNLAVVDWERVRRLGDEVWADRGIVISDTSSTYSNRAAYIAAYKAAARAYRLLAVTLQAQGMGDEAARYFHRAQIMRRKRRWHERRLGAYLFSGFLALFAGYGYSLRRVFTAYAVTVALFAALYLLAGIAGDGTTLSWPAVADAAQISLNAIHGRVFFAQFGLDTLQSWLATAESIVGILIEGVFVAVLIQRLFSR